MNPARHRFALARYGWAGVPIPLLLTVMVALWVAGLRTSHESRAALVALNVVFMGLASLGVVYVAGRSFLVTGDSGLAMLGCGALLWGLANMAASALMDAPGNLTVTVHNLGALGAALCHLGGLLWHGRARRPGWWLGAAYAGVVALVALLVWGARAGWTPVFFVEGQGGTMIRQAVLLSAIALFTLAAWLMLTSLVRTPWAFLHWYGLGLALLAAGMAGVLAQAVHGSLLGWTGRITQYLGGVYLLAAAVAAARETGTWNLSLTAIEEAWRVSVLRSGFGRRAPWGWVWRYGLGVAAIGVALGLRLAITAWVGPGLPTYITFYPAVMVAALLGGFGPGLLSTATASLAVAYWVLPPQGQFAIASPVDRLGLVIFWIMGVFMSGTAALYRRDRDKAAAYDRDAALREGQARLATFAQATFEGIVESEAGRIRDCNEQFARMLGYTVSELRGMEIADLTAPEDRDRVAANIRGGWESAIEHVALRKDGTRILVEARGRPVSAGSSRRHTAIRDITARHQAEEALRESEARYRAIGESIDYGVWVCAPDGRNIYASESFLKLVGLTQEQCSNFGWGEVLHPEDAARTLAAWRKCARTGGLWDMEHRFRGADGQWHSVLARGVPVRDERGQITCWAGINLDISRLKQAEERLKGSLHEKEVLLKEIHHRVKNNLQVISSLVDLQAAALDNPVLHGLFQNVRDRVRSMALVHEKLYQSESLARVDFAEYARSLLTYLWRAHGSPAVSVRLTLDLHPVLLSVETAVPCGLILNELATNTLKHAFRGRSEGEVTVALDTGVDGRVRLVVRDNGVGLAAGRDWRQSGSLGLRLVPMLAKQLNGVVEASNDGGAEFRLTFDPRPAEPSAELKHE